MPYADSRGVRLYYETTGSGAPIVLAHEFAGDIRSWEHQVRFLSRWYRCIAFNARGYPPSDVPTEARAYSQDLAVQDLAAVMRAADAMPAHVVALSMGAYAALHLAVRLPQAVRSLVIAGCGYGSNPADRARFRADAELAARRFESSPMREAATSYAMGPYRLRLKDKDPRAWGEFASELAEHSSLGLALTMRGVQKRRKGVFALSSGLRRLRVPTLVITGDEDEPCLEPSLFLKRTIPTSSLWVMPRTAHTVNLEEPQQFNTVVSQFLAAVDAGRWRDGRSATRSASTILGPAKPGVARSPEAAKRRPQ